MLGAFARLGGWICGIRALDLRLKTPGALITIVISNSNINDNNSNNNNT